MASSTSESSKKLLGFFAATIAGVFSSKGSGISWEVWLASFREATSSAESAFVSSLKEIDFSRVSSSSSTVREEAGFSAGTP
jgi:hypothetical protein